MLLDWFKRLCQKKPTETDAPAGTQNGAGAAPPPQPEPEPDVPAPKPAGPEPEPDVPVPKPAGPEPEVTRPGKLSMKLPQPYGWVDLAFESQERLRNWDCPGGLDRWSFRLGGMAYDDYRDLFLCDRQMEQICKLIDILRDIHGRRFLKISEERPTFDSGDRDWDSYKWYGIMPHDGGIDVMMVNGGYSIGVIEIYRHLTDGGEAIRPLLELL